MKKKTLSYLLMLTGAAALVFGLFLAFRQAEESHDVQKRAEDALGVLIETLPERSRGMIYEAEDEEMGCLEINGLNFVGYIQIGDAYMTAVQNAYGSEYAPRMKEGQIRNGTGVVMTGVLNMDLIEEGTPVIFTDVSGVEYSFYVDYIGGGNEILKNAQLIVIAEGMTNTVQLGCLAE